MQSALSYAPSEITTFAVSGKPVIVLVDDDKIIRMLISEQLSQMGYEVIEAPDIKQASTILEDRQLLPHVDVMILDRELNGSDGLTLARQMKNAQSWKHIPIIMLTGHDEPEQVREGLEAGIFYYLCKPTHATILHSVVELALQEVRRMRSLQNEMQKHRASFARMESAKFDFSTLEHVEQLACFLANCFADPQRVLTGLAELMINAVEHGMLGIDYAEKGEFLKAGIWHDEIQRRQLLPINANKKAEAIYTRREEGCYISIRDPGPGFNWRDYLTFDPARAGDMHGRGIAQAAVSFDKLVFNEQGNEAVGFLSWEPALAW